MRYHIFSGHFYDGEVGGMRDYVFSPDADTIEEAITVAECHSQDGVDWMHVVRSTDTGNLELVGEYINGAWVSIKDIWPLSHLEQGD